jgi:hypothetical protein
MIARSYILANLKTLDRNYTRATSLKESLFYSKLAILELCGWIEESMDDVVLRCAYRRLSEKDNKKFVEEQIVKKTHGFDYQPHFRRMLIQLLGIINVERIEKSIDQGKRTKFTAALDGLKSIRNQEAHTHIKGVTRRINAPSVTLGEFSALYDGLLEFETALKRAKF